MLTKEILIFNPIPGKVVYASEIPDQVFAERMVGEAVGIRPSEGKVYAPCDGTVEMIPDTKHGLIFKSSDGVELLIDIGIDTYSLKGKPFSVHTNVGERTKQGTLLMSFDLEQIEKAGLSTISVMAICNSDAYEKIEKHTGKISLNQPVFTCVPREAKDVKRSIAAEAESAIAKAKISSALSAAQKMLNSVSLMSYLQKLGKAVMLPVSALPICGILIGVGYLLCPAAMQGGAANGLVNLVGLFLVKAGCALIDNMPLLFVIGIGMGMSEKQNGTGALAALASWLTVTNLLSVGCVTAFMPAIVNDKDTILAFSKIANPFVGVLCGVIGASCYNRFKDTKTPDFLSFFSGKRCVAIIAGLISIGLAALLLFIWPLLFKGLVALGKGAAGMGSFGVAVYTFLNRLLIPIGLHHALNNVFWFDTIGIGDLSHYWAGHTSKDVGWSLGVYMAPFFPCMMFGIPGGALAILHSIKEKGKRKETLGILFSAALCAFVCGVSEPFEFSFMFVAPLLYVAYSLLYAVFGFAVAELGFRAGFCFSAGALDLLFSASLPAAQKIWLILPLGLCAFFSFYIVFRFLIEKLDLPTPGRKEEKIEEGIIASSDYDEQAKLMLKALGEKDNIKSLENCITRLRIDVADMSRVDPKAVKAAGGLNLMRINEHSLQIIIGTKVQFLADAMERMLG